MGPAPRRSSYDARRVWRAGAARRQLRADFARVFLTSRVGADRPPRRPGPSRLPAKARPRCCCASRRLTARCSSTHAAFVRHWREPRRPSHSAKRYGAPCKIQFERSLRLWKTALPRGGDLGRRFRGMARRWRGSGGSRCGRAMTRREIASSRGERNCHSAYLIP
jgi:hypothetical protein